MDAQERRRRAARPEPPSVRRGGEADAAALAALHVRAWQWAYRGLLPDAYLDGLTQQRPQREVMWRRTLQGGGPDRPVWIAELDGRVAGFCSTASAPGDLPDAAEVQAIYLEPDVVGTGVGAALMGHALADLRARGVRVAILWVLDTNSRARRFYERGGWRADGATRVEEVWGATVQEVRYRISLDGPGRAEPPERAAGPGAG